MCVFAHAHVCVWCVCALDKVPDFDQLLFLTVLLSELAFVFSEQYEKLRLNMVATLPDLKIYLLCRKNIQNSFCSVL